MLNTLEGDPRFFFDDSQTPQAQGTGTEEWGGGGDYWGGLNMTLPFAGHPVGARSAEGGAVSAEDKIESAYRFLLADLMPFGKNARDPPGARRHQRIDRALRDGHLLVRPARRLAGQDRRAADRRRGQRAQPSVRLARSLAPYEITSRYEWGRTPSKGKEIYPADTDRGRTTRTASEFTLKLDPKNLGVLLRRKLDYSFPNQRAEVFVAAGKRRWKPAGVWYLAGSNTCVYSNPRGELGATQHVVQTSNRRFRDDEFLLPRELTEGRSSIRVRVKFTPVEIAALSRPPAAGTGLERDALHRVQLRDAAAVECLSMGIR